VEASRQRRSWLDRLLSLFTDVGPGEGANALLLAFNLFLLLAAYYFIKPVRDGLVLAAGGPNVKSYSSAAQTLILVGAIPLYGILASRLPRRRLINWVTLFFAACLVVFYVVARAEIDPLVTSVAFYIWLGIFNAVIIAQFWSFANDIYTTGEGERLFPIVMLGASMGALAGSFISGRVIPEFGVYTPMILAVVLLVVSLVLTNYVDAHERRRTEADLPDTLTTRTMPAASQEIPLDEVRKALTGEIPVEDVARTLTGEISLEEVRRALEEEERPAVDEKEAREKLEETLQEVELGGEGSPFGMVFRVRYLLMIALLILFLNWVNTNGEWLLGGVITRAAEAATAGGQTELTEGEFIGTFWANFYGVVNLLALFLQLFVVSRAVKYLGVQVCLLFLPVIALGSYTLLAFYPVLALVRWTKTAENATDYSLQNTVQNMLFLPCTREQKYKAKQAIDTFFKRAGDLLSAGVVFVGTTYFALQTAGMALVNIVLVFFWLIIAVWIGREYKRLVASGQPPGV
jgi:AAA family ATP:ADP antiporter